MLLNPFLYELEKIADDSDLWLDDYDRLRNLRQFVEMTFLPFHLHSYFVEASVEETSLVSATGREEQARSLFAIVDHIQLRMSTLMQRNIFLTLQETRKRTIHQKEVFKRKLFFVV